jgi:hypothetical protein
MKYRFRGRYNRETTTMRQRRGSGCFRLVIASFLLTLILGVIWLFSLLRRVPP